MAGHDLIVVGASAGGVEALSALARGLPAGLPAAVCVVLHVPSQGTSVLPTILARAGPLPAAHARDGEPLRAGRVYVAPPDHHLLVKPDALRVTRGPRENGHRPAADPLFRTAARHYGPRVVGVVLSGVLDDGTAGLLSVKRRGGVAVVQRPDDALYPGMPTSALAHVTADHAVAARDLGGLLARLAAEPPGPHPGDPSPDSEQEADMAELEPGALHTPHRPGTPSGFGCPECGGVMFELHDGEFVRYRCRVGHAWTAEGLLAERGDALEAALWSALRALEERAALARQMGTRAAAAGRAASVAAFRNQVEDAERHAALIRDVLLRRPAELPPAAAGNSRRF